MDGEETSDEPPESPEALWLRDGFYSAIDSVIQGMKNRFEASRFVLEAFDTFSPKGFSSFFKRFFTPDDIENELKYFVERTK
jgi:hypothetical protein